MAARAADVSIPVPGQAEDVGSDGTESRIDVPMADQENRFGIIRFVTLSFEGDVPAATVSIERRYPARAVQYISKRG